MELLNKPDFRKALLGELYARETLDHPLFGLLTEGGPNLPLLRALALEGAKLVDHFPHLVAALLAGCPQGPRWERHHRRLAENTYEEFTGKVSGTSGHRRLLGLFLKELGLLAEEAALLEPLPGTLRLIDYRWDLIRVGLTGYHKAVAAVMVASEGQNIQKKARGLRQGVLEGLYGLSPEALTFFRVHYQEDPIHVRDGLALLADLCDDATKQAEAIRAVRETCDLYWDQHTELLERFIDAPGL